MMETDHLNEAHGIGREDGSPGHSPGKPMRQLEFNQAMSDFRHMFPDTDEEVIEAVLRANSGMVDATIDQLLTMNIDAEQVREMYGSVDDDDDLPDHILMSVEQEVMAQEQASRESRLKKRQHGDSMEKTSRKESEDCPPSYTEAVKSHLSHHHRGSNHRHHHSPTSGGLSANTSPKNNAANSRSGSHHHHHHRYPRNGMQHLLDLGPESAPGVANTTALADGGPSARQPQQQQQLQHSKHHSHHHSQRASSTHHRRRGDSMDSASPHKSRPGRNLLATNSMSSSHSPFSSYPCDDFAGSGPQRKSSLDSNDLNMETFREKSPSRWHSSYRERTSPKRPAYRNWNPPLLGTLPDDFLRITPVVNPLPQQQSVSFRAGKPSNTHLHRTFSAVGPERPKFSSSLTSENKSSMSTSQFQPSSKQKSSHKPHRSFSFAGHSSESTHQRKLKSTHPSGLAQHEFSPDFLQERMKENELRRLRMGSSGLDPELAQYLADERLAIMLQNSEFLQELRGDHQFMMTLERDHKDIEEGNSQPEVVQEPVAMFGLNSDEEEGYGEDRRDTLEAFPFTQQLPPSAKSEDVELRKKLKHMGKASRNQFAALARKFFAKRKKKTAHQILKESQAPSMMNLLDEDEDPEFDDLESAGDQFGSTSHYDQETHPSRSSSSWNERHRHHDDR